MIVISRKKDQGIVIRHDIVVSVVEIRGDRVQLGIDYPGGVSVRRGEVLAATPQEEEEANSQRHRT